MRILIWHCDSFRSEVTQRGRSPVCEDITAPLIETGECLLVYAACEKQDEETPDIIVELTSVEVMKLARQLKVQTIVLHSFAHLFVELAAPLAALDILKNAQSKLRAEGFEVFSTPFGWFNTPAIKAKGHSISRVAREIRAT